MKRKNQNTRVNVYIRSMTKKSHRGYTNRERISGEGDAGGTRRSTGILRETTKMGAPAGGDGAGSPSNQVVHQFANNRAIRCEEPASIQSI